MELRKKKLKINTTFYEIVSVFYFSLWKQKFHFWDSVFRFYVNSCCWIFRRFWKIWAMVKMRTDEGIELDAPMDHHYSATSTIELSANSMECDDNFGVEAELTSLSWLQSLDITSASSLPTPPCSPSPPPVLRRPNKKMSPLLKAELGTIEFLPLNQNPWFVSLKSPNSINSIPVEIFTLDNVKLDQFKVFIFFPPLAETLNFFNLIETRIIRLSRVPKFIEFLKCFLPFFWCILKTHCNYQFSPLYETFSIYWILQMPRNATIRPNLLKF